MIIDVIAQTRLFYSSEETTEKQETLIFVYERQLRCYRDVIMKYQHIRERGVYDYDYRCYLLRLVSFIAQKKHLRSRRLLFLSIETTEMLQRCYK